VNIATTAAEHLQTLVRLTNTFKAEPAKVISVYSVSDLLEIATKGVKMPLCGIMYEGARRKESEGGKQVGATAELVFSLIVAFETSVISKRSDLKAQAQLLLDELRNEILGTRAPTGHLWGWLLEAPASPKSNVSVYIQRWSTTSAVTPKKAIGSTL